MSPAWLLPAVVILPLAAAPLSAVFQRARATQAWLGLVAVELLVALGLVVAGVVSGGEIRTTFAVARVIGVPFELTLAADPLSAMFVVVIALTVLANFAFSATRAEDAGRRTTQEPLALLSLSSVLACVIAGNLLTLYVFWQLALVVNSVMLAAVGGKRGTAGAVRYFLASELAATMVFAAAALAYSRGAQADLSGWAASGDGVFRTGVLALLFAAGALGAGLLPVHTWHTAAISATEPAELSLAVGLLNRVGLYVVARTVLTVMGAAPEPAVLDVVSTLGALTAVTGGLAALALWPPTRIVASLAVAQAGLAFTFLGAGESLGLGGALAMVVAQAYGLTVLTLSLQLPARPSGAGARWWSGQLPLLGFVGGGLTLAGVPPWPGFVGYLLGYRGLLSAAGPWGGLYILVTFAAGLLTALAIVRLGVREFRGRGDTRPVTLRPRDGLSRATLVALLVGGLALALLPGAWLDLLVGPASGIEFSGGWGSVTVAGGIPGGEAVLWPAWATLLLVAAAGTAVALIRRPGLFAARLPTSDAPHRLGQWVVALALEDAALRKTRASRALVTLADAVGGDALDPYFILRRAAMSAARGAAQLFRLTFRLLLR